MTTTFSMTTAEVIQEALENIGIFGESSTVTTAQTARGLKAINLHLKLWSSQGLDGFIRATQTVTLVSGTASYALSPRPTQVVGVVLRDDNDEDRPIRQITKEEYEAITDKDDADEPSVFWCDLGTVGTVTLYTWPVMNASGFSLRVDYRRPLSDVIAGDTIDIGQEWLLALVSAVEVYLAPKYGKPADVKKAGQFYGAAYGVTKQLPPNPLLGWPGEYD